MPDCEYCDQAFESEAAYLEHLDESHDDELSTIDQRRVDEWRGDDEEPSLLLYGGIGLAVLVLGGLAVWGITALGGDSGTTPEPTPDQPAPDSLPDRGDQSLLENVEKFPSEGTSHVSPDTDIEYERIPPTSGPHYGSTTSAGYYEERPSFGSLVHSLEHGAVVIYYDPGTITQSAKAHLQSYAQEYTGAWQSVIVVPHPEEDPESPYVLTAWRTKLELDSYDKKTVRTFIAEYLGRGPENPVR